MERSRATGDPLVGLTLGDYRILEVIGEGGMGQVYRAHQTLIHKQAAIKVLRPEHAANPLVVNRLLEEARAVNTVRHRGIVDIFGFGQLPDGRHYLIMELLDGEALDRYLERTGPLGAPEAIALLAEICDPLYAAHGAGIIHRDLKPSNVFMVRPADGSRYLKLLDFGLAKATTGINGTSNQTSMSSVTGTPSYMAPEQARAKPVSARTDLYALGCMAYELLTGRPPYIAESPMDVLMMHVGAEVPSAKALVAAVPDGLDALVRSMMAKDPADRPGSAEQVRVELRRLGRELSDGETRISGAPPRPPVPPRAHETVRVPAPGRRRAQVLGAGAGALIALVAVGVWRSVVSEPHEEPLVLPRPPVALVPPEPEPVAPLPPERVAPEVVEPTPAPASKARRAPVTEQALAARLDALEKRLREKAGGDPPDLAAMKLLQQQRLKASMAQDDAAREQVMRALRSWEQTFLK